MSVRYSEDFKKEVARAYMIGDKSTAQIAAEFNIAKSSVSDWAKNMVKNAYITIPLQKITKANRQKKFADSIKCLKKKIKRLNF